MRGQRSPTTLPKKATATQLFDLLNDFWSREDAGKEQPSDPVSGGSLSCQTWLPVALGDRTWAHRVKVPEPEASSAA